MTTEAQQGWYPKVLMPLYACDKCYVVQLNPPLQEESVGEDQTITSMYCPVCRDWHEADPVEPPAAKRGGADGH